MKPDTLFLCENGIITIINEGEEVTFSTVEEYKKYSGVDLSDKTYLCYQPPKFQIDKAKTDGKIPKDLLDTILTELDRVDEYVINKADLYFGKTDAEKIKIKQGLLKRQVQQYIYSKYDMGAQASIQALYVDPDTSAGTKTTIKTVWDWIRSVMVYYYTVEQTIETDFETTWNFGQFDAGDPAVALKDLIGG